MWSGKSIYVSIGNQNTFTRVGLITKNSAEGPGEKINDKDIDNTYKK